MLTFREKRQLVRVFLEAIRLAETGREEERHPWGVRALGIADAVEALYRPAERNPGVRYRQRALRAMRNTSMREEVYR